MSLAKLYLAQKGRCFHCNGWMSPRSRATADAKGWSREHIWPKALKHPKDDGRIVLAHQKCNERRGTKLFDNDQLGRVDKLYEEILKL